MIAVHNSTANELWQFLPDGNSGSWSLVLPPASSNFSELDRVVNGLSGCGDGLGFSLGGNQIQGTELSLPNDSIYPSGLVIYNTSSGEWFKVSSTGYSWTGSASNGAAQFVPSFGSKGILFFLGGDANDGAAFVPFVRALYPALVEVPAGPCTSILAVANVYNNLTVGHCEHVRFCDPAVG